MIEQSYLEIIKAELDTRAHDDEILASNLKKENKSWEECGDYIYNEITKMRNGQKVVALQDDLVYGMAMHYWEDDKIVVSKQIKTPSTSTPKPAPMPSDKEIKAKKEAEKKAKIEKMQGDLFAGQQEESDEQEEQDEEQLNEKDEVDPVKEPDCSDIDEIVKE